MRMSGEALSVIRVMVLPTIRLLPAMRFAVAQTFQAL
jgi:hypothetical protein